MVPSMHHMLIIQLSYIQVTDYWWWNYRCETREVAVYNTVYTTVRARCESVLMVSIVRSDGSRKEVRGVWGLIK